jgi:hypothetical protein
MTRQKPHGSRLPDVPHLIMPLVLSRQGKFCRSYLPACREDWFTTVEGRGVRERRAEATYDIADSLMGRHCPALQAGDPLQTSLLFVFVSLNFFREISFGPLKARVV